MQFDVLLLAVAWPFVVSGVARPGAAPDHLDNNPRPQVVQAAVQPAVM